MKEKEYSNISSQYLLFKNQFHKQIFFSQKMNIWILILLIVIVIIICVSGGIKTGANGQFVYQLPPLFGTTYGDCVEACGRDQKEECDWCEQNPELLVPMPNTYTSQ
jgi:hypothetical protein